MKGDEGRLTSEQLTTAEDSWPESFVGWRRSAPAEALLLAEKAALLDGAFSGRTLLVACEAHLLLGADGKAVGACERASGVIPNDFTAHSFLAAAQANVGDIQQAQAALQRMLKTLPGQTIAQMRAKSYSNHPEYQRLAEMYWYGGLRKAGLSDR